MTSEATQLDRIEQKLERLLGIIGQQANCVCFERTGWELAKAAWREGERAMQEKAANLADWNSHPLITLGTGAAPGCADGSWRQEETVTVEIGRPTLSEKIRALPLSAPQEKK